MAITKLKDIVTVFTDKWTYGDSKFGYESEVNETHNTVYPSMIIQPPLSVIPDTSNGREEFTFEVNFYNLYQQAAQSAVTLQNRWDNLQDLSTEWLDLVIKNYQDQGVKVYLIQDSIEFERVKEVANDKLVQIKLFFTLSAFTKCFRTASHYPTDFNDLVVWLRADSGVTFDIPTQQVSAWKDYSGNTPANSASQSTSANQPLRIGYDGANDKARINFNGTTQHLISDNSPPITDNDFTIFVVAKYDDTTNTAQKLFSIKETTDRLNLFISTNGKPALKVVDDLGNQGSVEADTNATDFFLVNTRCRKNIGSTGSKIHIQINDTTENELQIDGFNNNTGFDDEGVKFFVGFSDNGGANSYFKGDICELIVFNRSLETNEIADLKEYLNNKFKIY